MDWISLCIFGFLAIIWIYIVARVVTRAVLRTLEERKDDGKKT
jgi:hypothetical protein